VYEPGKCIRCGICVRIAVAAGEPLGMTFQGRGYSEQVAPSFNNGLEKGLGRVWRECVEACPTAALAFREEWDPMGPDHLEREQPSEHDPHPRG
jgi:ferredoxin